MLQCPFTHWTLSSICFRAPIQLSHQGPAQPLVNGGWAKGVFDTTEQEKEAEDEEGRVGALGVKKNRS